MSTVPRPEPEEFDPFILKDGRYHCERIIGEGSMGRTYLARDDETDTEVALKALYPSRLAEWKDLELFQREAEILQKLDHPQIPAYIDAFHEGEGDGVCYYLVQTYVEGPTLRDVMQDDRFDEREVIDLGLHLLDVLVYMQSCEPPVVHRDIKPENIVMRDDDGKPTLVDFGAVREVVRLTMRGGSTIIGTYGYMPPEQLMGRAIEATDLYALGITLLECFTRKTPDDLHGEDAKRLIAELSVSDGLRRVLERLCAPQLADRYERAEQVRDDLRGVGEGGALVHASRLEDAIATRKKEEEKALKKATSPGIHLGYVLLLSVVFVSVIAALYFLVGAMATSFQSGFLLAAVISGAGLIMNFFLLATRYTHDAWEPPEKDWVKTKGEVVELKRHYVQEHGYMGWLLVYEFETRRGVVQFNRTLSRDTNPEDFPSGMTFDVYYRPRNPAFHEFQDITVRGTEEMLRLFDERVEHTPE